MLVLGLLLIIAAIAVGFGAVYDGGESATVEILGQTVTTTLAGVFVAGAVSMLALLLGVMAVMSSMGRARRKRSERKETKARQTASVQQLEDERAALRAENERLAERLSDSGQPMGSTAGTASGAAAGGAVAAGSEDHEHHSGARGLMDKVTGRSGTDHTDTDHTDTDHTDTDHTDTDHTDSNDTAHSDRVVDSTTDLTARDQTSDTGRHRDTI